MAAMENYSSIRDKDLSLRVFWLKMEIEARGLVYCLQFTLSMYTLKQLGGDSVTCLFVKWH